MNDIFAKRNLLPKRPQNLLGTETRKDASIQMRTLSNKVLQSRGAAIAQWIRLQPSILLPHVRVPSTPSTLFQFI